MARIVADRLVEHLERSGFVVMKRPPAMGGAGIGASASVARRLGGDRHAEHPGPSAVLRLAPRRRLSGEREVGQNGRIISTRGR
jgi:hypothetical protein